MNNHNDLSLELFETINEASPLYCLNYQFHTSWAPNRIGMQGRTSFLECDLIENICESIKRIHNDVLSDNVQLQLWSKEANIKWHSKNRISPWFMVNHVENNNVIFVSIMPDRNLRSNDNNWQMFSTLFPSRLNAR